MKFKYCSNCGSIGEYATINGLKRCSSCKLIGNPLEGGMDEINAFRKKMTLTFLSKLGGNNCIPRVAACLDDQDLLLRLAAAETIRDILKETKWSAFQNEDLLQTVRAWWKEHRQDPDFAH